ncbi:monocarboxylate transporter 12-like isoform X2 [Dreissena polymorpha]|uniref:monocarboxylate transporter 12-like isoform X2 n=1 Tax=Dreissena polymorpha TaxID=45954 RepID=UPI002264353D|nr:monocarboxylate transporter 12-like isoform X2 [Dreissena polymorpha]
MCAKPDGGWGWVIVASALVMNLLVDGVKYSFGILLMELVRVFGRSKGETSLIMSIQVGAMLLSGPLTSAFVNRFGCRAVAFVGTLVATSGFLISAFASSVLWLYVSFGLIAGLGFGLLNMPPYVMIARYFDRRLSLAIGLGSMGSGLGTLIFNPMSKMLIDEFSWRGTLVIQAGMILHGLACSLVLRPLNHTAREPDKHGQRQTIPDTELDITRDLDNGDSVEIKSFQQNVSLKLMSNSNLDKAVLETKLLEKQGIEEDDTNTCTEIIEIIPAKSFLQINQKRAFTEDVQRNYTGQKRWLSIAPLRNPGFVILIVSNLLTELAQNVPFAYLPYMMVDKGFPKQDTVTVIFFIGLLSTIARAVIGLIADRKWFSRARLCCLVLVINGVLITMAPFCASRTAFLAFGILFGLSAGSASSLSGSLVPDLFGAAQIADFSGINMFFSAVAAFTGLPAAGALFDLSQSYIFPFVVAGCEMATSGLLIYIIPLCANNKRT